MKFKSSSTSRKVGLAFVAVAVLCIGLSISYIIAGGDNWVTEFAMMLFGAALWGFCGIMLLLTSKKQKEAENKKVKISAFNYGKAAKKR